MRICVYDVAAESGGALTILNRYYRKALSDKQNEYLFIIGLPELARITANCLYAQRPSEAAL